MLVFLIVSILAFIGLNKLGYFLASGRFSQGYQGSKNIIAMQATYGQKIIVTIQLVTVSVVVACIVKTIIWVLQP